jgi:hypothetical protein
MVGMDNLKVLLWHMLGGNGKTAPMSQNLGMKM